MADGIDIGVKVSVEFFPQKINEIFNTSTGPIGTALNVKANLMLVKAAGRIGTRYSGHHGKRLAESGRVVSLGGAAWAVEFVHPAAKIHHDGTTAKNYTIGEPGKRLFNPNDPARSGGGIFVFRGEVTHPGSDGNPYLVDGAEDVGFRKSGSLRRGTRLTPLFRLPGVA